MLQSLVDSPVASNSPNPGSPRVIVSSPLAGTPQSHTPSQSTPAAAHGPVAITVKPHSHSKYCNRVREVCTAAGAYREGNTLICNVSASVIAPAALPTATIVWYRSAVSVDRPSESTSGRVLSPEAKATPRPPPAPPAAAAGSETPGDRPKPPLPKSPPPARRTGPSEPRVTSVDDGKCSVIGWLID